MSDAIAKGPQRARWKASRMTMLRPVTTGRGTSRRNRACCGAKRVERDRGVTMLLIRTIGSCLVATALLTSLAFAQDPQAATRAPATPASSERAGPQRLPEELVEFFEGEWTGAGEFANGKKIEADVSFAPDLDGQWLVYRHTDRAPGKYKALGVWGYEAQSRLFVMSLSDGWGGLRTFVSEGWRDGQVVFRRSVAVIPGVDAPTLMPTKSERFVFARQGAGTFKMTYETSVDGKAWQRVDYVVFRKAS